MPGLKLKFWSWVSCSKWIFPAIPTKSFSITFCFLLWSPKWLCKLSRYNSYEFNIGLSDSFACILSILFAVFPNRNPWRSLFSSMPLDAYMYAQKLIIWDLGSFWPVQSQTLLTNIIALKYLAIFPLFPNYFYSHSHRKI